MLVRVRPGAPVVRGGKTGVYETREPCEVRKPVAAPDFSLTRTSQLRANSLIWRSFLGGSGHPPLQFVRFGQKVLATGIEEHAIERVRVRIYSPAKTVVDLFRYRRTAGKRFCSRATCLSGSSALCCAGGRWRRIRCCRKIILVLFRSNIFLPIGDCHADNRWFAVTQNREIGDIAGRKKQHPIVQV